MRLKIMGGRGGYGGRDGSTGLNSPGGSGYVETVWFSPRELGIFPGDGGGDGRSWVSCGGGGAGGYHHHSWDGGWGGRTGCRGSSGGGGGGGAASAVLFPGVGWIVAGGGGGAGGNGNFGSQSWMPGRSWNSNNGSFTGSYGGDPGGSDGGGGGGGGGGWNAGNGGGISWVSWANEFGGVGGFAGSNNNTAGIGIVASDWRWNSDWRGWVTIDVMYASVPSAPTSLRVSSEGNGQATVVWNVPADSGGLAVSRYEVCWRAGTSTSSTCTTTTALSHTATGLVNGTVHWFRVRAENAAGWSSFSGEVGGIPRTTATAPTSLTATPGNNQVVLSWGLPESDGGAAIQDYQVQFQEGENGAWQTWNDGVNTNRSYTVTPLANGVNFGFRIAALNAAGWGSFSTVVRSIPFTAPSAPTGVRTSLVDSRTLNVAWTAPTSTGGKAVDRYRLEIAENTSLTTAPTTGWTAIATQPPASQTSVDVGNLTTGSIYWLRVRADNGQLSPWSTAASGRVATVPGTPARPTVSPFACTSGAQNQNCSGGVEVSVPVPANGGADISVYRVQFAPVSSADQSSFSWVTATPQVRVETGTVRANITGLTNGQPYVFRVSAINAVGQGAWSENSTFSTTLIPRTVPGAPTGVSVSNTGNGFADLTWTAPSNNGGLPIENYLVEFETVTSAGVGSNTWTAFSVRPSATILRVTGLTNGVIYRFRVSAGNASGSGPTAPTGMVSAMSSTQIAYGSPTTSANTARPLTTPAAPTSLALTSQNVALNVSTQIADTGGTPITAMQYTLNGGAWITADTFTVSGSTYGFTIPGLTNGTTYAVVVRAVNSVGAGPSSSSASDFPFTTPDAPSNLRVTGLGNTQVSVAWSAPANNGGESVDTYTVTYRASGASTWESITTTAETRTISGLANGTTYEIRVQAFNQRGGSAFSDTVTAVPRTIPGAPTMSSTVGLGDGSLAVSWTPPTSTGGNALTGYVVSYATNDAFTSAVTVPVSASTTSLTITNLVNGTSYFVRVVAVNSAGSSPASLPVSGIPRTVPTGPQNVSAVAGENALTASWQAPSSNGGNAIIRYRVSYSTTGVQWSAESTTTSLTYTFSGLEPTLRYYVRVSAENAAGVGVAVQSAESVTVYAKATAPDTVTARQGNGQATVRFDATGVKDMGSPVTGYRVTTWNSNGSESLTSVAPCTTSTPVAENSRIFECVVTGLTNKVDYVFRVTSVNAAGESLLFAQSPVTRPGTDTQTISVPPVAGPVRAGDRAISLEAKASSGLPVSYETLTPNVCTLVGSAAWGLVSPDRAGTCEIRITQSGANSAFDAAPPVTVTFTVWPSAPSPARITSIQATASGQITVSWETPTFAGGTAIKRYTVTATPVSGGAAQETTTTSRTGVISGLPRGQYTVVVTAVNDSPTAGGPAVGLSSVSAPETITVFDQPGAPESVTVTTGDQSLVVSWNAPTNTGGLTLTGFTATARTSGESGVFAGQCVAGGVNPGVRETCTISGLTNDHIYVVRVTASHAFLTSESSTAVTQTAGEIAQTVTLVSPETVTWSLGGSTSVSATSDSGLPVTFAVTAGSTGVCSVASTGRVSILRAGSCVVVATASGAENAFATASDTRTIVVLPAAPAVPTIASVRSSASGSLTVSWTAPERDGGRTIEAYTISLTGADTRTIAVGGAETQTIINTPALPNGVYTVTITATNGVETSTAASSTYALVVAPGRPETVTATTGDRSLAVTWSAPTFNGGSPVIAYRVTATPVTGDATSGSCMTGGALSCVVLGLTQDATYSVTVRADNEYFLSETSTAVTATTGQLAQTLVWETVTVASGSLSALSIAGRSATTSFSQGSVTVRASSRATSAPTTRTGVAVAYGTSTSEVCLVGAASGIVTPLRAGTCVVTADQSGTGNAYSAASQESFTVTINQVTPLAPVRISWTFTPETSAVAGAPASETGTIRVTYQVPGTVALGGGVSYTLSAIINGQPATTCSASECVLRGYVFPSNLTVTSVAVTDTIAVDPVPGVGATGSLSASGTGSINLTVFRPDPSAAESVTASNDVQGTGTAVIITWRPPSYTGENNLETVTSYVVTLETAQGAFVESRTVAAEGGGDTALETTTVYSQTFTVLPATSYVVKVQAINRLFISNPAGAVVTTPSPPTAPTSLSATAQADGSIALTWAAPTSSGGQPVTTYRVIRDTTPSPIFYYDARSNLSFDPAAPGVVRDLTTRSGPINATVRVGTTSNSGTISVTGDAFQFSGGSSGNYLDLGPQSFDFSRGLTIDFEADFKDPLTVIGNHGWERILDFGNGNQQQNILVSRQGTTNNFIVGIWRSGSEISCVAANGISSGLKRYTISLSGTGCTIRISDGAQESVIFTSGNFLPAAGIRNNNWIGRSNWTADELFQGSIRYLRIYSESYTSAQIGVAPVAAASDQSALTHSTGSLTPGQIYSFIVQARNAVGWSDSVTITAVAIGAPPAPETVTATTTGQETGTIAVSWSLPTTTNGSAITGYKVELLGDSGVVASKITGTETSTTFTGIRRGTYTVRVAAENAAGFSPTPTTSASVTVSRTQTLAIRFDGQVVSGAASFTVESPTVQVTASASGGSSVALAVENPAGNPCVFTQGVLGFAEQLNATSASCTLRASTVADDIYEAAQAAITITVSAVRPDAPETVTVTPGNGTATVTWSAPTTSRSNISYNGGAGVTDYVVQISTGGSVVDSRTVAGSLTTTFETLTNGTDYTVTVSPRNGVGTPVASTPVSVRPRTVPDTPTIGAITNAGVGRVVVAWSAPATGGETITSYTVQVLTDSATTAVAGSCEVSGSARNCTIGGLKRSDTYDVRVAATNIAGTGAWARLSETTTGTRAFSVGEPQTVTFRNVAGDSITTLTTRYGAPSQPLFATSSSGAPVTFEATTVGDAAWDSGAAGSQPPCSVANGILTINNFLLKANETQTTCVITARVAADDVFVAASQTLTIIVNAVGPDAPDPVQLIPGDNQITIHWTVYPHPRVGGARLTGFIVEYTREFAGETPTFGGTSILTSKWGRIAVNNPAAESHTVTGLLNGYTYAVRVAAVNKAGIGEWDPLATPTGEPLPVRGPTNETPTPMVTVSDRLITVAWRAPIDETRTVNGETFTVFGDGGSPITGYRVTLTRETATYVCTVEPDTNTATVLSCGVAVPANRVPYSVSISVKNAVGETTTALGSATPIATQTISVTAVGTTLGGSATATSRTGSFTFGSTVQLTGTASSGLPVAYTSTTPNVCAVSQAGVVSALAADTCTVVVSRDADDVFETATSVTITFTIGVNLVNDTPTVSVVRTSGATFSAAIPWAGANVTVQFEACGQSGQAIGTCETTTAVTVTSTTTAAASAALTSLVPGETYTVRTIVSAGGSTSQSATTTFTTLRTPAITTDTPTLTALTPISLTLQADTTTGTGVFSAWTVVTGSLPSGLTLDATTAVLSGTPSELETRTVTIRVTDSGGNTGDRTYTLVVQGASPNLVIGDITDRAYSPSPLPTSVSAVNLNEVIYGTGTSTACSINAAGTITMLSAGECSVLVTSRAHGVYAAASVIETFTISKADQAITFAQPSGRTFALGETFTLAATASSGEPVTFSTTTPSICTLSGPESSTVTIAGAGGCIVVAHQVPTGIAADRYNAAPEETRTIVIAQAAPTITLTSPPRVAFGETETVTVTVSDNGAVTVHLLVDGETLTVSETATITTSGSQSFISALKGDTQMTLRISAASTANFTPGFIDVVFDLVRAGQAITIPLQTHDPNTGESVTVVLNETGTAGTITYAPNRVVDLKATSSSGDTVTYVSNNPAVAVVETNTIYVRGVGTTVIKVDQAGSFGRYTPAVQREVTLTVIKAAQDLTVPGWQETATFGVSPIALNARNEIPGRGLTLISQTLGTCEITNDGALRVVGVDTCTVVATDPGDANYLPRTETFTMFVFRATRTLTISTTPPWLQDRETQTLNITYRNEQVRLTYTASQENDSPRIITLTGPCELSSDSSTITTTGAGTCVLTVSVNQGRNFGPATSTVVINVAKAPQAITNIIKGTDPKRINTPQLPTDVVSWTIDTITVAAGSVVSAGQVVARLTGLKADGATIPETVTASEAGVVSAVRSLSDTGTSAGLSDGVMLLTIEVTRVPTEAVTISAPTLPESATSWAVTGTSAVDQVLDIGQVAARIRPQVDVTTTALTDSATSWRAENVLAVGTSVESTTVVATVVPQARIALPALLENTTAWVVKTPAAGPSVAAGAPVTTISGVRVLRTPALPVGATSWSIIETATLSTSLTSTSMAAVLQARDATNAPFGDTVTVVAGIAGSVNSYSETTTGLLAGAPILTVHSTPQDLTSPMAGTITTAAVGSDVLTLAPGTVIAVVSGTSRSLVAVRAGTVTWINPDLVVLAETETVVKVQGDTVTVRATSPGTVSNSRPLGTDAIGSGAWLVALDAPRADSRNIRVGAPTLPTTAPETATYTVAWSVANGSAVLIGDTLTILTVNAPDVQVRTPDLPQATDKNPAAASFTVVSTLAVGDTVTEGGVVAVIRAVEANGTPFADTIDVVAAIAGTVRSVIVPAGSTGINQLVTLLTMSYDSITVTSSEPGRVLTSITPGTAGVSPTNTLAFVEKTLRFGEVQRISATQGRGTAPLAFATVNETGTPDTTICEIVPGFLGGTGVRAKTVGTCYITINQAEDANYLAAPTETVTILIDRAEQEVTLELPTALRFGDDPIVPVVTTAATGAAITLQSGNEDVFIVENGTVVPTGVGSASLTAVAGSTELFNQSAPVRQTIEVTRGVQTISVLGRTSGTEGEQIVLLGSTRSRLTVVFTSATPGLCSVAGTLVNLLSPGNCVINADQPGDELWLPADRVEWRIQVNARPLSGGDGPSVPTLSLDARLGGATTLDLRDFAYFDSATVTVEDVGPTFVSMVSFTNNVLRVTPPPTFSGFIRFTLVAQRPDRTDRVPVVIRVPSANPTQITFQPLTATTSRISWNAAANAISYVVLINGKPSCLTPQTFCVVRTVLGPDSVVTVRSVGREGVVATLASAGSFTATPGQVLTQATLVGSSITAVSRKQIRQLATRLAEAGYERVRLVVPVGPTERRAQVRTRVSQIATLFSNTADIAVTTSLVKATATQVRRATRQGTVPSATVTIRLVVPVTGPRVP